MITEFIDHAQQLIAQRGSLINSGFFRPCHPCVVSLKLQDKIDIKPLQDVLAYYWGNSCAKAVPIIHLSDAEFSKEDVYNSLINNSFREALTKTKAFTNLLELYFVDIIECNVVEDDESFANHCKMVQEIHIDNHTIHKILVLLHNHDCGAPRSILDIMDGFKSGVDKEMGYDTVFVMSDALRNGGYENDKMRRLTDFMSILAFNTDDRVNFRNTLSGVVGFRDAILTVSAQNLRKPIREIAMASLHGITVALSGDEESQFVNRVTKNQLVELFGYEKKNTLKDADFLFEELCRSEGFPKEDVFRHLPYADANLNTQHSSYEDFFDLAVKANFFDYVDEWVHENKIDIKKKFLEKFFSVFSFSDLQNNENKKIINDFFDSYVDRSFGSIQNYNDAVSAAKKYLVNALTLYWKEELDQITPNIRKIQQTLQEIGIELIEQLNYYVADQSIIDFYSKRSKDFLNKNGDNLRNNLIFCSGDGDQLKWNLLIQIQEIFDLFFKSDEVFALNYIEELNTRMRNLAFSAFDAVDFVADEIQRGNETNVYFPPHGMANFTAIQEICVLPNDETLAKNLSVDLPSVSIRQVQSGNECVRIAILKVE